MRRRPRRLLVSALFTGLCAGSWIAPSWGQEVDDTPRYRSSRPYQSEVEAANPRPSNFHVAGGLDVRDQYFFRGYNRASSGVIIQPYFDLGYTIYRDENLAITPHAGAWFNFTETKGPENPEHWNEFRPSGGFAFESRGFTVDLQYVMYKSPSELFGRSEEVGATLSYDDRRFWPASSPIVALNPSVAYFWEFDDNKDGEEDSWFGVSLEPELHPVHFGKVPVVFSFPLAFGGSWDGYYFDDHGGVDQAGYWTAGVKAGVDLVAKPQFRCRLEAEVDYIRLLADSVERANGGDNDDITLRFGIHFRT